MTQRSTGVSCDICRFLLQEFVREGHHFEAASVVLGLRILPGVLLDLALDLDAIAGVDGVGERFPGLTVQDDRHAGGLLLTPVLAVVRIGDVQRGARHQVFLRDAQFGLHASDHRRSPLGAKIKAC
jgi:hypothetical protein